MIPPNIIAAIEDAMVASIRVNAWRRLRLLP
jgi:hypothetical protein